MADGEAKPTPTLKRGLPPMRITKEQKKAIRARRKMIGNVRGMLMTRKQGEEYKQKQKKNKREQGKRWYNRTDYNIEEEDEFMEMVGGYKPNIRGSIIKDKKDTRPRSEKIETTRGVRRRSSVNVGDRNYKRAIKREKEQNINKITRGAAKIIAGKNDKSLYGRIKDKTRRIKYNRRLKKAQKDGMLLSRKSGKSLYKLKF